jgi:hypothetical protein
MHYCQNCDDPIPMKPAVDAGGRQVARCTQCGTTVPARRLPLFVVSGASASGKSAITQPLIDALPECAVFDVDWLIDPLTRLALPDPMDWAAFRDAWLAVAHGLAQGGRSTVLLSPFVPEQLEELPLREWVGEIHFAALDCSDDLRRQRLEARPKWREREIDRHLEFAAELRKRLDPVISTDEGTPEDAAASVARWVRSHLR